VNSQAPAAEAPRLHQARASSVRPVSVRQSFCGWTATPSAYHEAPERAEDTSVPASEVVCEANGRNERQTKVARKEA
jgi:hypothetical protein